MALEEINVDCDNDRRSTECMINTAVLSFSVIIKQSLGQMLTITSDRCSSVLETLNHFVQIFLAYIRYISIS